MENSIVGSSSPDLMRVVGRIVFPSEFHLASGPTPDIPGDVRKPFPRDRPVELQTLFGQIRPRHLAPFEPSSSAA